MSQFLISGINGFIGSHIAERLISLGHRVKGIIRRTSDLKFIDKLGLRLFCGDVTNPESLVAALNSVDIVIHVAGLASDWGSYEKFFNVNVIGTKNMAEVARACRVKRFVHISTTALHGFLNARNIDESSPLPKTIFPYCETKKEAERWLFDYAKSVDMEVTAIRPGNVFGPNDHTFIDKYLEALESGKAGCIDNGRHWTCPTYVENLVDGIIQACFEPAAAGQAFIITDGLEIDWRTFTDKFADALGVKRPRLSIPFKPAYAIAFSMEMLYNFLKKSTPPLLTRYRVCNGGRDYHFSIGKAKRLLKYEPKVSFDEAVKRTVAWYRQR